MTSRSKRIEYVLDIEKENPLMSILEGIRNRDPSGDEVFFLSGGPVDDRGQSSMIPAIGDVRVLFLQPHSIKKHDDHNPLDGFLDLSPVPDLIVKIQKRKTSAWVDVETQKHQDLESALKSIRDLESIGPVDPRSGLSPGGFVGILGYDLGQWTSAPRMKNTPDGGEVLGIMWITSGWIIHHRLENSISLIGETPCNTTDIIGWIETERPPHQKRINPHVVSEPRGSHKKKARDIIEAIEYGHVYQVNYGRSWQGEVNSDPWDAFVRLSSSNPAPYSAWMSCKDLGWTIASSSPEQLLHFKGEDLKTSPIKGTSPRMYNEDDDILAREQLMESKKDLAEHMMLVDLEKHDLSKVCVPGSVRWSSFRLESHPSVHHLVSDITGKLSPSRDIPAAISAMFPGGSITGCPKKISMAIINHLEGKHRGSWTGSIGHIHQRNKLAELNILIRTLDVKSKSGLDFGRVMAGGGIVHESIPEKEAQEAEWKADAVLKATWDITALESDQKLPTLKMSNTIMPRPSVGTPKLDLSVETIGKKIIILDNMDSFTNNIRDMFVNLGARVSVLQGWSEDPSEDSENWLISTVRSIAPSGIVIGPGPSRPEFYARSMAAAESALRGDLLNDRNHIPVLGICLGHQALCLVDGFTLGPSEKGPVHGAPCSVNNDGTGLFSHLEKNHIMMRYNSLVITETGNEMVPNAWESPSGIIMGVRHRHIPIHGVQFHPESAGSVGGHLIAQEFLSLCT